MGWILALILGGIVGWLLSYFVRPERRSYLTSVIAGAIGAFLGVWFFGDLLGIGFGLTAAIGVITLLGVIWGIVGAAIVTLLVQFAMSSTREEIERGTAYSEEIRRRRMREEEPEEEEFRRRR